MRRRASEAVLLRPTTQRTKTKEIGERFVRVRTERRNLFRCGSRDKLVGRFLVRRTFVVFRHHKFRLLLADRVALNFPTGTLTFPYNPRISVEVSKHFDKRGTNFSVVVCFTTNCHFLFIVHVSTKKQTASWLLFHNERANSTRSQTENEAPTCYRKQTREVNATVQHRTNVDFVCLRSAISILFKFNRTRSPFFLLCFQGCVA
jgi:hypothetical protein